VGPESGLNLFVGGKKQSSSDSFPMQIPHLEGGLVLEGFLYFQFPALFFRTLFVTTQVARSQNSEARMKTPATRFEDLVVWQNAHQFVLQPVRGRFASHSEF
jgi:hypothetical protein